MLALPLILLAALGAAPGTHKDLPVLHVIREATLSPSYSCQRESPLRYNNTALFLTEYGRRRNSPDLLFNGVCDSPDDFQVSTAGDDMSLIADLGKDVRLEDVSAHKAFRVPSVARPEAYSAFQSRVPVVEGHTYAVLVNKDDNRGLFLIQVVAHEPNKEVVLRYAVKAYAWHDIGQRAAGFDWTKPSVAQQ